jgi:hypothetical protein
MRKIIHRQGSLSGHQPQQPGGSSAENEFRDQPVRSDNGQDNERDAFELSGEDARAEQKNGVLHDENEVQHE